MNGGCRLQIKRGIVLRHGVLAVRFLAHFDVSDGISTLLDVCDLRRRVVRSAVEHGDRDHRRQIVGEAAGEEKIEAAMLVPSTIVHVFVGMPRIDGGHTIGDSILARTLRNLDEGSIRIHRTRFDPLDRVTNTIPNVVRAVLVAGIGRSSEFECTAWKLRCQTISA